MHAFSRRIAVRLSYANVVATIALFISLGGASYAVVTLPAHSVGSRQLRRGAVTPSALGFPLGARGFSNSTPTVLTKTPCNSVPPPGSPPVVCPTMAVILQRLVGNVALRAPGELALSAIVELTNSGPPGTSATVTIQLPAVGRRVEIGGGQTLQVPLQALAHEPSGTRSVYVLISEARYSSDAPGDLIVGSTSLVATVLPQL